MADYPGNIHQNGTNPVPHGPTVSSAVERMLRRIAPRVGTRRLWLFHKSAPGNIDVYSHHDGGPAGAVSQKQADALIAPWLADRQRGEAVHIGAAALAADSGVEKETNSVLTRHSIRQCLLIPAIDHGQLAAVLCVEGPQVAPRRQAYLSEFLDLITSTLSLRAAETARIETTRLLTAITDTLPVLIFEIDIAGRYVGFCSGPRELMVADPEEFTGKPLADFLPPDLTAQFHDILRRTLENGSTTSLIYYLDLPVGRRYFDLSSACKAPTTPGALPTVLFLAHDVTDKLAQQARTERLQRVVRVTENHVLQLDVDGRITWVNPSFERRTGWRLSEMRGRALADGLRAPGDNQGILQEIEAAMARNEPCLGQMIRITREGEELWVKFNLQPLSAPGDVPDGFAMIETDITRMKEEEAQKKELARQAYVMREQLENALNAVPAAAALYDADERLVHYNPAFIRDFPEYVELIKPGIKLEDIFRRAAEIGALGEAKTPADLERWLADYRCEQLSDEICDGNGRWFQRIHSRTQDGGIICLAIDITERRGQMARLDAANEKLTAAIAERDQAHETLDNTLAAAEVGTWKFDLAAQTITTGRHWFEMLGYGADLPETFPFAHLFSMVHPDDHAKFTESPAYAPEYGSQTFEFEARMRRGQGDWIWALLRGQVIERDADGQPLSVVGVHLDITERKKLQEQLGESQRQMRSVMENSVAALTLYDDQGFLLFANSEAERILPQKVGRRIANLEGHEQWVSETLDGDLVTFDDTTFARVKRAKSPVRNMRYAIRWPDGTRQVIAFNGTTIDIGDGKEGVVLSFQDVTAQENTMQALREALAHAEETSRAKSAFLANMSHEIRTPLNGILGLAEVLEMQSGDAAQKRLLGSIRDSGKTLLTVLNSVLDIAKIESGKLDLDIAPFCLADMVNEITPLHEVQAEEKGLELSVFLSPDCTRPIMGDPHRIRQITHNLLSNAVKFTTRGEVTLEVLCKPGRPVVIRVSDTGVGMTQADSDRVFEKFAQADSSVTRRYGGTGLGLPIVRELVTMMGGDISVTSTPDKGTTVTVSLPLEPAEPEPVATARPDGEAAVTAVSEYTHRLRILAADDNVTNREVLSEMLAQLGETVELAQDGQAAVDLWREAITAGAPFDTVLLDITMPVMDGASALALIREEEAREELSPVFAVAVTGHAELTSDAEASGRGFDARIQKPCDLATIRAMLDQARAAGAGAGQQPGGGPAVRTKHANGGAE